MPIKPTSYGLLPFVSHTLPHLLETGGRGRVAFIACARIYFTCRLSLENTFWLEPYSRVPHFQGMLTEKQRAFVEAMVACGGKNAAECARIAGYSPSNARQTAYELLQKPEIIQTLVAHTKAEGGAFLPGIMKSMLSIALDPSHKSAAHVGLQILSMFGLSPIAKIESKKTVEHTTNLGALEELKLLAAQLRGLPAPDPKLIDLTPIVEEWSAHD